MIITIIINVINIIAIRPDAVAESMRTQASCKEGWEFESQRSQTNDLQSGYICNLARRSELLEEGEDWLAQNQDNVIGWSSCRNDQSAAALSG